MHISLADPVVVHIVRSNPLNLYKTESHKACRIDKSKSKCENVIVEVSSSEQPLLKSGSASVTQIVLNQYALSK